MVNPTKVKCAKCGNEFETKLKQNFAGFYTAKCPKCSDKSLYPLGKVYLSIYWIVVSLFVLGIVRDIVKMDWENIFKFSIAGLALTIMSIYALYKNSKIAKSRQAQ